MRVWGVAPAALGCAASCAAAPLGIARVRQQHPAALRHGAQTPCTRRLPPACTHTAGDTPGGRQRGLWKLQVGQEVPRGAACGTKAVQYRSARWLQARASPRAPVRTSCGLLTPQAAARRPSSVGMARSRSSSSRSSSSRSSSSSSRSRSPRRSRSKSRRGSRERCAPSGAGCRAAGQRACLRVARVARASQALCGC